MFIKALQYVSSACLIMAALYLGNTVQSYLELGIPGSIIGMLTLFTLMTTGIIPAEWVKPTAQLFIRYMILLFIPVSVGLIQHLDLLSANALQILASTVGATTLVIVCLGWMLEKILVGKQ
jgi:holin-like protein